VRIPSPPSRAVPTWHVASTLRVHRLASGRRTTSPVLIRTPTPPPHTQPTCTLAWTRDSQRRSHGVTRGRPPRISPPSTTHRCTDPRIACACGARIGVAQVVSGENVARRASSAAVGVASHTNESCSCHLPQPRIAEQSLHVTGQYRRTLLLWHLPLLNFLAHFLSAHLPGWSTHRLLKVVGVLTAAVGVKQRRWSDAHRSPLIGRQTVRPASTLRHTSEATDEGERPSNQT